MRDEAIPPILFSKNNRIAHITLNRPEVLNSLNHSMLIELAKQLEQCSKDPEVDAVVLKGAGERAFCAGFDLRSLYMLKEQKDRESIREIFKNEYELNYYISTFTKPYISMMHGYTMGGGLGLSVHGSHRIACEGTIFAMPEVTIGLFPDVGASYFLNQSPGYLGFYLALSGAHITVEDGLYAGLATHFLKQDDYENFLSVLSKQPSKTKANVDALLLKFQQKTRPSPLVQLQLQIDRIFSHEKFNDVITALEQDKTEFSKNCLEAMSTKSPVSLKVTFELMKRARGKTLRETIEYDYLLLRKFRMGHDFFEGIRALIIDKDRNPNWQPNSLNQVDDLFIKNMFAINTRHKLFK